MTEDPSRPAIKVTDNRHFERTGEKRKETDTSAEPASVETPPSVVASAAPSEPERGPEGPPSAPAQEASKPRTRAPSDLSEITAGLSSSFSLLIARLAQETEIYLGLVPYPGKEKPEPDQEASRAMIDMLSMLQEKTRGNLEPEEISMIESLLYTYRLEFVRRFPAGGAR